MYSLNRNSRKFSKVAGELFSKNLLEEVFGLIFWSVTNAVLSLPLAFAIFIAFFIFLIPAAFHGVGDMSYAHLMATVPRETFTFWVQHVAVWVRRAFEVAWVIAFIVRLVDNNEQYRFAMGWRKEHIYPIEKIQAVLPDGKRS